MSLNLFKVANAENILFYGNTCPHCLELQENLRENNFYQEYGIEELEVYEDQSNKNLYLELSQKVNYSGQAVPLLVIDQQEYVEGKDQIIDYFSQLNEDKTTLSIDKTTLTTEESQELNRIIKKQSDGKDTDFEKEQNQIEFWKIIIYVFPAIFLAILFLYTIYKRRNVGRNT